MENFKTPQERLIVFIKTNFKTQVKFAEYMNIKPADVTKYVRKKRPSVFTEYEKIIKLKEKGLNIEWYKEGKGEMLLTSETNISEITTGKMVYVPDFTNMTLRDIQAYYEISKPLVEKAEKIIEAHNGKN